MKILLEAPSPYLSSISFLKILNAIAGSVVLPDLEITFIQISLPSHISRRSDNAEGLMLFPAKYMSGVSFFSELYVYFLII